MVRRCVVKDCRESDISVLSHRFPKTQESAMKWQKALKVENYSLEDLQRKNVVCTRHFSSNSYRNEISNSLNTTAVPNLDKNLDNERIFSTNPANKHQQQEITPARCHKLPNQKRKLEGSAILNMANVKLIRIGSSQIMQNKQDFEESLSNDESLSNEVEETFECFELNSDTDNIVDDNFQEITGYSDENMLETPDHVPLITYSEQETQTDPSTPATTDESKEDKLVKILYPEFERIGKIELIELVKEKNRKIEALNEKIEKLELAMKNLL